MRTFPLLLSFALLLAAALPAAAETPQRYRPDRDCLAAGAMESYLDRAFAERRIASGEMADGNAFELFASRRGSWTMVEQTGDGRSCVAASGERLELTRRQDG